MRLCIYVETKTKTGTGEEEEQGHKPEEDDKATTDVLAPAYRRRCYRKRYWRDYPDSYPGYGPSGLYRRQDVGYGGQYGGHQGEGFGGFYGRQDESGHGGPYRRQHEGQTGLYRRQHGGQRQPFQQGGDGHGMEEGPRLYRRPWPMPIPYDRRPRRYFPNEIEDNE